MNEPAYFPASHPALSHREVQCFRGLFVSRGGPWEPVRTRPGQHVYRALWPQHLEQYDARAEYPELYSRNPPYYFAGLWFLNKFGAWELARVWTNYGDVGALCGDAGCLCR